jgi:putative salt-induced outer membrane protein YdiY
MLVNMFNDYEYDRFQNLDLRFVSGGGAGLVAIKTEKQQLDLLGGANYNSESFATGLQRDSAEGYWGDDWTYQLNGVTSLRQNLRVFNNLTNRGEYRVNFDISSATSLRKWLAVQLTLSDRYLSNPVEGRQRNDILFTTGLRLSFAR